MRTDKSIIVSISGGSGSGKSTLARAIAARHSQDEVILISCDHYYRRQDSLPLEKRALLNYDHPDSLEFELLAMHLTQLVAGKSFEMPLYDFSIHNRTDKRVEIKPAPVVVVEGILCLWSELLQPHYSLNVFVEASDENRLQRRLERDVVERGRTRESVLTQWHESVQPSFLEYCAPSKDKAHLVITTDTPSENDVETVMKEICRLQKVMSHANKRASLTWK